ncbi:MAG: lysophospholipid acyltransferase family protein [Crocinitomicaceae bacterium]|nr:lysophospholipid acyltransferase family protein [Crocinitomicaceae bacterium]
MGKIGLFILSLFGWKIDKTPPLVNKCVVCMGPHTSNWDFVIGRLTFSYYKVNTKFLIKKELFRPPFGGLMKRMGGIPVDRKHKNNMTKTAIEAFRKEENLFLVFTPEGTRKYNPNWKKGFYHIAIEAKVPIYVAYIDYKNKTGGWDSLFEPTGNIDADIIEIKKRLSKYTGKFSENGIKAED